MLDGVNDARHPEIVRGGRSVPLWAVWVAHAIRLCVLPSGLWRIALALGVPVGLTAEELRASYDVPGWGTLQIILLSVLVEAVALLALGLVRPWGEVFPRWLPVLGGRRVPIAAAVVPAAGGAVLLTALTTWQLTVWGATDASDLTLIGPSYAPLLAWGPLLGVLTFAYARRRRSGLGRGFDGALAGD